MSEIYVFTNIDFKAKKYTNWWNFTFSSVRHFPVVSPPGYVPSLNVLLQVHVKI